MRISERCSNRLTVMWGCWYGPWAVGVRVGGNMKVGMLLWIENREAVVENTIVGKMYL